MAKRYGRNGWRIITSSDDVDGYLVRPLSMVPKAYWDKYTRVHRFNINRGENYFEESSQYVMREGGGTLFEDGTDNLTPYEGGWVPCSYFESENPEWGEYSL